MADFTLNVASAPAFRTILERDVEKGHLFVPGKTSLKVFDKCTAQIELPFCDLKCDVQAEVMLKDTERGDEVGTILEVAPGLAEELRRKVESKQVGGEKDQLEFAEPATPKPPLQRSSVAPEDTLKVSPMIRLKALSMSEKLKLARTSKNQTERRALARLLDSSGWEALLNNPNISTSEVANIAKKATVPFPLIERIALNGRWAKQPSIRRALLANPKLSRDLIHRLLRATPRHELKLAPKQTAYPVVVRTLASEMLAGK